MFLAAGISHILSSINPNHILSIGDIIGPAVGSVLVQRFSFNTAAATFSSVAIMLSIFLVALKLLGLVIEAAPLVQSRRVAL